MIRVWTIICLMGLFAAKPLTAQVKERFESSKAEEKGKVEEKDPEQILNDANSRPKLLDKLVFGGYASLSLGSVTFISLAPSVGYQVTDQFTAGVGYIYQYVKINQIYNYSTGTFQAYDAPGRSISGPNTFVNYRFLERFYAGSQLEYLNHDFQYYNTNGDLLSDNIWTPVWFLEAGLYQRLGKKGFGLFGIRVNLLDDIRSPYASWWYPVIGFYF